jgi:two-component system, cell cycle response regulator
MTALILVVDDRPTNVLLLETKLSNEYYRVITARDGYEAIQKTKELNPDLVLMDVMMPGIDGFEVCRRIKADPQVAHIPVVMVTALSSKSDRLRGLEAGADDFLTKPFNDIVFFARTKSLIRMKMLMDELRLREQTVAQIGGGDWTKNLFSTNVSGAQVLVVDDDAAQAAELVEKLSELYEVHHATDTQAALDLAQHTAFDAVLISTEMHNAEGLRLASLLKTRDATRHVPLVIMVSESRTQTMLKALELGINDYLLLPFEPSEMMARVRTQVRRKRYQEALLSAYAGSGAGTRAMMDSLTRVYNRHFMDAHLLNLVQASQGHGKPLTLMIIDIDHFKPVNDTYGHPAGDEVLREMGQVIMKAIRTADMAARFGGEEFVVLLPETELLSATAVTDRIRHMVEQASFREQSDHPLRLTVSIGAAELRKGESAPQLLKRADEALFQAKNNGRNRVQLAQL